MEKGLGIVSQSHFVYNFSRKLFLMLYSINWLNFIVWLALILEMLGNMCMTIFCFPGCDVINFEINFVFLIKPFFYMPKIEDKNLNILRAKRALKVKWKTFFIICSRLPVAKNCLRPESASLIYSTHLL